MLSNNETTARLICEGLKNLLKTKNLDRIRIKEITDEVGLMRPTFYIIFRISTKLSNIFLLMKFWSPCGRFFRAAW